MWVYKWSKRKKLWKVGPAKNSPWGRGEMWQGCPAPKTLLPFYKLLGCFSTLLWSIAIVWERPWVLRHDLEKMQLQHCVATAPCRYWWVSDEGRMIPSHSFFVGKEFDQIVFLLITTYQPDHHMIPTILRKLIGSRKVDDFGIWRTPVGREGWEKGPDPGKEASKPHRNIPWP